MEFVSIHNEQLVGYISYSIDRSSNNCYGLRVINFTDNTITFGIDLYRAIKDIFYKYNFNKLKWSVAIGNPAEKGYNKLVTKFGGRVVGVYEEDIKLWDGTVVDTKIYEVLKRNLKNS